MPVSRERRLTCGREALVLFEAVVLNFEEEVVLAEDVAVGVGDAAGVVVLIVEDGFVEVAAEAGGEADEAFGVCGEQVLIDAGLVIEAFEVGGGDEVDEVAVAFLVFAEEDEVVVAVGVGAGLVVAGDVDFAADDGVDAGVFGGVVEGDGAEEVAVVGHADGGHFLFGADLHELVDFAGAVEEGVVGVVVKVNEGCFGHVSIRRGRWFYFSGWDGVGLKPCRQGLAASLRGDRRRAHTGPVPFRSGPGHALRNRFTAQ